MLEVHFGSFVWSQEKEFANVRKHGVNFTTAALAFRDYGRKIFVDDRHSDAERRFFCIGKVDGGILTVRFTMREEKTRIIGAGYWRKGVKLYEREET